MGDPVDSSDQSSSEHQQKLNVVSHIKAGFLKLGHNVDDAVILESLENCKKLGVTNSFMSLNVDGNEYLVRINGRLWAPYQRKHEQMSLDLLAQQKIATSVLVNDVIHGVQICQSYPQQQSYAAIVRSGDPEKIKQANLIMTKTIAKYQGLRFKPNEEQEIVFYQLAEMLENTANKIEMMFTEAEDDEKKQKLLHLLESSKKIAEVLHHCHKSHVFFHGDLLPNSVYIDFDSAQAIVVDWEYSVYGYWSVDLAKVSCSMSVEQMLELGDMYHTALLGDASGRMPVEMQYALQMNRFTHQYLDLAWKVNAENYTNYEPKIDAMLTELQTFEPGLNELHLRTKSQPGMFSHINTPYYPASGSSLNPVQPLQSKL